MFPKTGSYHLTRTAGACYHDGNSDPMLFKLPVDCPFYLLGF